MLRFRYSLTHGCAICSSNSYFDFMLVMPISIGKSHLFARIAYNAANTPLVMNFATLLSSWMLHFPFQSSTCRDRYATRISVYCSSVNTQGIFIFNSSISAKNTLSLLLLVLSLTVDILEHAQSAKSAKKLIQSTYSIYHSTIV